MWSIHPKGFCVDRLRSHETKLFQKNRGTDFSWKSFFREKRRNKRVVRATQGQRRATNEANTKLRSKKQRIQDNKSRTRHTRELTLGRSFRYVKISLDSLKGTLRKVKHTFKVHESVFARRKPRITQGILTLVRFSHEITSIEKISQIASDHCGQDPRRIEYLSLKP